jgi:hypothetical protein
MVVLASCESPLDLDTPRDKILPNPIDSISLNIVSMTLEASGQLGSFKLVSAMLEIDTSSKNPLIWGSLELETNIKTNLSSGKLELSSLFLLFNNVPVSGTPLLLGSSNYKDSYIRYHINRGINTTYDMIIISDVSKNKSEISFSLDRENKKLWVYLDAQIHENRYFISDNNTNLIDSIPDVLFVKGRFQFKY